MLVVVVALLAMGCASTSHAVHASKRHTCSVHASMLPVDSSSQQKLLRSSSGEDACQHFAYEAGDLITLTNVLKECSLTPAAVYSVPASDHTQQTRAVVHSTLFNLHRHRKDKQHGGEAEQTQGKEEANGGTSSLKSQYPHLDLPVLGVDAVELRDRREWPRMLRSLGGAAASSHSTGSSGRGNVHSAGIAVLVSPAPGASSSNNDRNTSACIVLTPLFQTQAFLWTVVVPQHPFTARSSSGAATPETTSVPVVVVNHRSVYNYEVALSAHTHAGSFFDRLRHEAHEAALSDIGDARGNDGDGAHAHVVSAAHAPQPFPGGGGGNPLPSQLLWSCHQERARAFFNKHGGDVGQREHNQELQHFRNRSLALLRVVARILDTLMIPFWIGSGTLLGFYRQCDFIDYSNDVDIGVFIEDYDPGMIAVFEDSGLRLTHRFGVPSDGFELSFTTQAEDRRDELKVDVFFFYREDDGHVWNGGTQARTGNKYKYVFPRFDLCWALFFDMPVRIPCNAEEYVRANYGDNFMTPVRRWDWKASPPNVRPNGQWPRSLWSRAVQCDVCQFPVSRIEDAVAPA